MNATALSSPRRRGILALAAAGALLPLRALADERSAAALLDAAEQALRDQRPEAAASLFERASRLDDESATAELGMMRAWLQAGDHAHAVAWGRLVAGEHAKSPEAAAWADAVDALARGPRTGAAVATPGVPPLPGPPADPTRLAGATRLGCGLIDGGRQRLLVPPRLARRIADGALPWVLDGTGGLWRMADAQGGLQREAVASAEPAAVARAPALHVARGRPGRPVLVLHPAVEGGWPRLAAALLTYPATGDTRPGIAGAWPAAADGSPVFDACGHWLGWSVDGALEPAPLAGADATSCAAGPASDVASIYGQRYATAAVVWRPA